MIGIMAPSQRAARRPAIGRYALTSEHDKHLPPEFDLLPGDLTVSRAKQLSDQAKAQLAESQAEIVKNTKVLEEAEERIRLIHDGTEAAINTQLEAGKALAVLNSAGAAGALAFAQALYTKGGLDDFRFFVVIATFSFLIGAGAGASTPRALIYAKFFSASRRNDTSKYMGRGDWCLKIASIGFAVGALTFLWGLSLV